MYLQHVKKYNEIGVLGARFLQVSRVVEAVMAAQDHPSGITVVAGTEFDACILLLQSFLGEI